jgi:hypothetical protein
MNGEDTEENLNKSEISQVFEIALKRNMPVNFEVVRLYSCIGLTVIWIDHVQFQQIICPLNDLPFH